MASAIILDSEMAQVVEILPHARQGPVNIMVPDDPAARDTRSQL